MHFVIKERDRSKESGHGSFQIIIITYLVHKKQG